MKLKLFSVHINDRAERKKTEELHVFTEFVKAKLGLKDIPSISLTNDQNFSTTKKTFACFIPSKNVIIVQLKDRHLLDVCRSLAHELVHYKQMVDGEQLDGSNGSDCENYANAKAGELLRMYTQGGINNHGYPLCDSSESLQEVHFVDKPVDVSNKITKDEREVDPNKWLKKDNRNHHVMTMRTGHKVYKVHETDGTVSYIAHNPTTKQVDLWANGKEKKFKNSTSSFIPMGLSSRNGSTIKAHKMYAQLIRTRGVILQAWQHTPGGMKVWQKLQKERGVNIHGISPKGVPSHIDKIGRGTTHAADSDAFPRRGKKRFDQDEYTRMNMHLVAHKKEV